MFRTINVCRLMIIHPLKLKGIFLKLLYHFTRAQMPARVMDNC